MITKEELVKRFKNACAAVCADEAELTEIDSKFGDADHGYTMSKICGAIESAIDASGGSIKEMLDDAAVAVDEINGGSAVPLWNTWLDGMQEGAPDAGEMSEEELKSMFQTAFEAIDDFSGAKIGDKTMMDALIPATEALQKSNGSAEEMFAEAAKAAENGAEATKEFVSKFGRAKSYGKKTIGTPDAGALSMAKFFVGLSKA